MIDVIPAIADAIAAAGLLQSGIGWALVRRFARKPAVVPALRPPITVLKPLHGDEPLLEEALVSLCRQDYPQCQIVFGIQDPDDPARSVVERLQRRFPALDLILVVNRAQHGANRKVGNLINMLPAAKHETIVIADSDVHAAPGYLDRIAAALEEPGVGLVTTLYAGQPAQEGLVAALGAASITQGFLPGALMARALGRQDCLGATMALRRATLDAIGGFESLADHLADDAVLGLRVRRLGLSVALAGTIPATTVPETAMPALFAHELRWARTTQKLEPLGYALSAVQFPLAWSVLALCTGGVDDLWAWLAFAFAWLLRAITARSIERILHAPSGLKAWALPLRDLLSLAVLLASYGGDQVAWRGHTLRADRPALLPEKG